MLSILVPIYNFDCVDFIKELQQQCSLLNIEYEIICMDDRSDDNFKKSNQQLSSISKVTYIELKENIGRSKIRNRLADKATYSNLLFVDCDSMPASNDYITTYISNLEKADVICGGTSYRTNNNPKYSLRTRYGKVRECIKANDRNKSPFFSFMANNFCIKKEVFVQIKMDESVKQYGHEDTLFGIELKQKGFTILHIDNPLIHLGLENNEDFLNKTITGIETLTKLYKEKKLGNEIKLIDTFERNKLILPLFSIFYRAIEKSVLKNLLGSNPNLFLFDLFKLNYFCSLNKA